MKTLTIKGLPFPTACEALQHSEAAGGEAILWDGKYLVVSQAAADRLAAAGASFAYLGDHAGQIVTVPIN